MYKRQEWGFAKDVYIDNADQATMTELKKYRRLNGCIYNFWDAYKKLEILDRIKLQLGWIQQDCYLVVDECPEHLAELEKYSWEEDKDKPEDRNDHTINAGQYSWIQMCIRDSACTVSGMFTRRWGSVRNTWITLIYGI